MSKLIGIKQPEKEGDVFKLWKFICALIDAINKIKVSIVAPQGFCFSKIEEGNIQLRFDPVMALTPNALADGAQPSEPGNTDNPGDPGGGGPPPDPIFGTQHCDCKAGQQNQVFGAPISYVCYDVFDTILVYDNRTNLNPLLPPDLGSMGVGQAVQLYGIWFCREPGRTINMGNVCGGPGQPACPPASCSPTPPSQLRCVLYACDFDSFYC